MTNPIPCPRDHAALTTAFCPDCGERRPEAPPEMTEDERIGFEIIVAWQQSVGDVHAAREIAARKARELLAPKLPSVDPWAMAQSCGITVQGARRVLAFLSAPPAQPEPAKDGRPCAKCGKLRTRAEGGEVFTTCEGPGHHCDGTPEDAAEPAAPVASGEAEAGTIALDAWLDSRDVMQSTRSEVRHCYRSDLARATKGLRERTEKAERDRDQYREDLERTRADLAALRASQPSGLPGVGESFLANEAGAFTRRTVLCHSMYDTQFSDGNGCWYRLADEGKTWRRLPTGEKGKG